MTTETISTAAGVTADQPVRIRAHRAVVRKLGHWTTAARFDVRASQGSVVLDLRSPRIAAGDIEVQLDIDHAAVKLLVPDDAYVEHEEARRIGRCKVSDAAAGAPAGALGGRRIVLLGELRSAEVRVRRGGVAVLTAMFSREFLADARQAHRQGRQPTVADPAA